MPNRIQLKRIRGWRMPAGAVNVARPTNYGNRYVIGQHVTHVDDRDYLVLDAAEAVKLYREWLEWQIANGYPPCLPFLRGKDLACWCRPDSPCHADVLLEFANR